MSAITIALVSMAALLLSQLCQLGLCRELLPLKLQLQPPCHQAGSSCHLAICPNAGAVACPVDSGDLEVDKIEYVPLPGGSAAECNRGGNSRRANNLAVCLVLMPGRSPESEETGDNTRRPLDCYSSMRNAIKDEISRSSGGLCMLNSFDRLSMACYQQSEQSGLTATALPGCRGLGSRRPTAYYLNVTFSRKAAPTSAPAVSTPATAGATTTQPKPRCPPGYVLAEGSDDGGGGGGGRCESLAVSGDACKRLAARAPGAYQREDGDCAQVPETTEGVGRALAETKRPLVKAQVMRRFARTQEFNNITEVSGFASLLASEASANANASAAASADEIRQTVGDFLTSVAAFASKGLWAAGEQEEEEGGASGDKPNDKLTRAADTVLRAIDSLGRSLHLAGEEANITSPAIAMSVRPLSSGAALVRDSAAAVKLSLGGDARDGSPVAMVTSVVNLPRLIRRLGTTGRPVASRVVQVTLYGSGGARLDAGGSVPVRVLLLLPHLDGAAVGSAQRQCVFLDTEGAASTGGSLSDRGCRPVAELSDSSRTACSCEHLTSFAAVALPGTRWLGPDTHQLLRLHSAALRVLTYICLGASILCLLLTNVTYLVIKLRGPLADKSVVTLHRVHHNLCFALLLAQALFLAGFYPPRAIGAIGCRVLSGLTLYTFLCVFCWLLCEGLMYAKSLIIVLPGVDSAFAKIKFQHYCLLSYLAPLVIVAITAGLRHEQLIQLEPDLTGSGDPMKPKACWLSEELGTNYAFLAPMLLVCLANMFVFTMVLVKLTQRDAARCPKPDLLPYLRRQVKLSVTLAGLLGLTWMLALLFYFAQTHFFVALHYLFTLLNGLQGCFIFFTQIFAHDRIRDGWEKFLLQSRCTPQPLRAWLQSRRHARLSGTGSSQSKNQGKKAARGNKSSSGGSIPTLMNLLRRLSFRRNQRSSSGANDTTGVSELSPPRRDSSGAGGGDGGGGGRTRRCEESQPFLSSTRDESDCSRQHHRQAPLVTEDNFTSACPPPESGFFESQLQADDQSLFDITHSLAEPALSARDRATCPQPPPIETLPDRRPSQEDQIC